MKIGQLCVKIAGRDAGNKCIVIDIVNENLVLIDGNTRRKRCSIKHLEPIGEVKIKKNASHSEVVELMKKAGIGIVKKGVSRRRDEKPGVTK